MIDDARIALEAFEDGGAAWVRLTREVIADLAEDAHLLTDAIKEFEAVDKPAGREATDWLQRDALDWDGTTLTYLMLLDRRLEAFYASASSSVMLSQRDRKRARGAKRLPVSIPPRQPATLIAWLAKRRGASTSGLTVLEHAFSTAVQVSELQGNVALVLDPFDDATAELWLSLGVGLRQSASDRHGSAADGQAKPRRLWMPLREVDVAFG